MILFHRHTFDPEKWKCLSEITVTDSYDGGKWMKWIYTNTCKECGQLVEKLIESR